MPAHRRSPETGQRGARSGKGCPSLSIIDEGEQHEERQQVAEALE